MVEVIKPRFLYNFPYCDINSRIMYIGLVNIKLPSFFIILHVVMNNLNNSLILKIISFKRKFTNYRRIIFIRTKWFYPFIYELMVLICFKSLMSDKFSFGIINICCLFCKAFIVDSSVPNKETYREIAFYIIKGFSGNAKKSTELRSEEFSEIRKVRSLQNFQL